MEEKEEILSEKTRLVEELNVEKTELLAQIKGVYNLSITAIMEGSVFCKISQISNRRMIQ